jgi:hypothetical protein
MIVPMKLLLSAVGALVLCACSSDGPLCPTNWTSSATAPGSCQAPAAESSAVGTGIYGFVRTNAHGNTEKLVVGTDVFVLPSTSTTCDAASVNALAVTTTDVNGVFTFTLAPGSYRITSGEVPTCTAVTVDANNATAVALTSP